MTMIRRAALALLATLLLGLAAAPTASAQAFPNRPVRIVVPFAPGGGADILARMVGEKLRESWNQTVIVDNRPGASGVVGTAVVNKAEPDGYMLLMAATGAIRPPQADPAKTFEVTDYFTPITLVAAPPYVIVVHPSVKATSIAELIALAKARPDEISFGSSGVGTASHLSGMLFNQMAGIKLLHVPYKASARRWGTCWAARSR
ncbi:MAG: tripartite tricarboxylate transporter substrate-binding protein [Pseudomonadota bacterium]